MYRTLAFAALALLLVSAQAAKADFRNEEEINGTYSWGQQEPASTAPVATNAAAPVDQRHLDNSVAGQQQSSGDAPGFFNSDGYYTCTGSATACEQHKQQIMAECGSAGGSGDDKSACRVTKSRANTNSAFVNQACDDYIGGGNASPTARKACKTNEQAPSARPSSYQEPAPAAAPAQSKPNSSNTYTMANDGKCYNSKGQQVTCVRVNNPDVYGIDSAGTCYNGSLEVIPCTVN